MIVAKGHKSLKSGLAHSEIPENVVVALGAVIIENIFNLRIYLFCEIMTRRRQ